MNKSEKKSFGRFLFIWSGQFISCIGSGLTAFSLGVYAFEKTHSATVYSLIILFAFLPSFLLKPFGGVFSDRFDRRLLMIIGDIGSALGLAFILLMFFSDNHEIWVIYVGVAFSSVFFALQNPAYKSSVTDIVDEDAYSRAVGLMQLSETSRFLISPILAGFLLHFIAIEEILLIDMATYLIAAVVVVRVKKKLPKRKFIVNKERFITDFINGFKYTFSQEKLVWLLFVTSFITFAVGILQSLMGPMILAFSDSKTLGLVQSISAVGLIVSSFFIGVYCETKEQTKILSISLAFGGLFYALFGTSTNLIILIVTGFFFFATLPFINTSLDVLIRKNVENQMQGRVWSIVSLISQLGMIIAFSIAGFLADVLFNPLLETNGILTSTIGTIIGSGQGRGIGFMFVLSGILVLIIAIVIRRNFLIFDLKQKVNEN